MNHDRFFDSARGRLLAALRGRGEASACDLAREFGLSTNAVRQQCISLERDNLVTGYNVRRSRTKPTVVYKLTPAAEQYFPQRYDRMLNAVLREIRSTGGDEAVQAVFASISRRQADQIMASVGDRPLADRVAALTDFPREIGVESEATSFGFRIRERNCPYSKTVTEHPEICSVIRAVMHETLGRPVRQTDSLASGGAECRFDITTGSDASLGSHVGDVR